MCQLRVIKMTEEETVRIKNRRKVRSMTNIYVYISFYIYMYRIIKKKRITEPVRECKAITEKADWVVRNDTNQELNPFYLSH